MALTQIQHRLLGHLREELKSCPEGKFVYHTECQGSLPFGFYHWIMVGGNDISHTMSTDWAFDWDANDLTALEQAGHIKATSKWQNPEDLYETRVTFILRIGD